MSKFFKMLPILASDLSRPLQRSAVQVSEKQMSRRKQRCSAQQAVNIRGNSTAPASMTMKRRRPFAATCTEQGYTVYTCANCGDSYTDNFVAAKGHTFQDIIVPATCTHKGYVTHFCTTCGYEYSDSFVDEKGHSYMDEVVAPTCTEPGLYDAHLQYLRLFV